MSEIDLDAIEARANAATSGPWRWAYPGSDSPELTGMAGDENYTYETQVLYAEHDGGCACRKACTSPADPAASTDLHARLVEACPSRESRYVPWTFGEVFECVTCKHRERQSHTLPSLRGEGYDAVYSFPIHDRRNLLCMPCAGGFHDICAGPRRCDCDHAAALIRGAAE